MTSVPPVPGLPGSGAETPSDASIEQRLQELAGLDVTEHPARYEQLLTGLQQALKSTERGA
ncbi:hypothetical protein [Glutamicibacter sp. X7]